MRAVTVALDRRPPSRGDDRRRALLAALDELLRERQLAQINVGDIASAAGVVRSAFYFYFTNKATAVAALLEDVSDEVFAGAGEFLAARGDAVQHSIAAALGGMDAAWFRHRHLMLAMLDARTQDPVVRSLWYEWLDRFVGHAAAAIETHRSAGHAPPGPDATMLVQLLIGMNERALERLTRDEATESERAEALDAMRAVWSNAIFGRT